MRGKLGLIFVVLIGLLTFILSIPNNDRCTTIAVSPGATVDGSSMNTNTADCSNCDWRINKVPARDWPDGSMRPIYLLTGSYPLRVRSDRGATWNPKNLENIPALRPQWEKMTGEILGYIPQVRHTYAVVEGMYGILNEHQVGIGESTCPSRLWAAPMGSGGGKALLEISELSQIALERSKTAREAIQMMGDLAVKYGFYSGEWDIDNPNGVQELQDEGGEALSVIDKHEAWIFHISPDDTGTSAVWVAQRIPHDHISIVANAFVIRKIDPKNPDFMFSSNMWDVASRLGWWSAAEGLLDFRAVFGAIRMRPDYNSRRVWRIFSLAAPSLHLSPIVDPMGNALPFSVKVDQKLAPADLMRYQRDHFEGTPYSTTEGIAGGPYGDPNRWDQVPVGNLTWLQVQQGEFPRTMSMFRTSYSFVNQAREHVPDILALLWFCQYAPDSSTYTPVYVYSDDMPMPFMRGAMQEYTTESAWWNFAIVGNYAARFYKHAMAPVRVLQNDLQTALFDRVNKLESKVLKMFYQLKKGGEGHDEGVITEVVAHPPNKMPDNVAKGVEAGHEEGNKIGDANEKKQDASDQQWAHYDGKGTAPSIPNNYDSSSGAGGNSWSSYAGSYGAGGAPSTDSDKKSKGKDAQPEDSSNSWSSNTGSYGAGGAPSTDSDKKGKDAQPGDSSNSWSSYAGSYGAGGAPSTDSDKKGKDAQPGDSSNSWSSYAGSYGAGGAPSTGSDKGKRRLDGTATAPASNDPGNWQQYANSGAGSGAASGTVSPYEPKDGGNDWAPDAQKGVAFGGPNKGADAGIEKGVDENTMEKKNVDAGEKYGEKQASKESAKDSAYEGNYAAGTGNDSGNWQQYANPPSTGNNNAPGASDSNGYNWQQYANSGSSSSGPATSVDTNNAPNSATTNGGGNWQQYAGGSSNGGNWQQYANSGAGSGAASGTVSPYEPKDGGNDWAPDAQKGVAFGGPNKGADAGIEKGVDENTMEKKNVDAGEKYGEKQASKESAKDSAYEGNYNAAPSDPAQPSTSISAPTQPLNSGGSAVPSNQVAVETTGQVIEYNDIVNVLTVFTTTQGQWVSDSWKALFPKVLASYRDGYQCDTTQASIECDSFFYPVWWLNAVGYFDIPPNNDPNAIEFWANPFAAGSTVSTSFWFLSVILTMVITAYLSNYYASKRMETPQYESMDSKRPPMIASIALTQKHLRGSSGDEESQPLYFQADN